MTNRFDLQDLAVDFENLFLSETGQAENSVEGQWIVFVILFSQSSFSSENCISDSWSQLFISLRHRLSLCIREHENISVLVSKYVCVILSTFHAGFLVPWSWKLRIFLLHMCVCLYFSTWLLCMCCLVSAGFLFHAFLRRVEELRGTAAPVHHLAKNHPRLDF